VNITEPFEQVWASYVEEAIAKSYVHRLNLDEPLFPVPHTLGKRHLSPPKTMSNVTINGAA
jgi:hypothetical protein